MNDLPMYIVGAVIVLFVLFLGFMLVEIVTQAEVGDPFPGEIIDRSYKGDTRETDTSIVVLPDTEGNLTTGVVTSSSGSDEEWNLVVATRDHGIVSLEVPPEHYYYTENGDTIYLIRYESKYGMLKSFRVYERK